MSLFRHDDHRALITMPEPNGTRLHMRVYEFSSGTAIDGFVVECERCQSLHYVNGRVLYVRSADGDIKAGWKSSACDHCRCADTRPLSVNRQKEVIAGYDRAVALWSDDEYAGLRWVEQFCAASRSS